jgi:hypothetical protein
MPYEMVRLLNSDHPYRYDGTIFGGTRLWTPSAIATALWLDADSPSSITLNGSTVSQWNDKSGNGRNFSQPSGSLQPAYNASSKLIAFTNDALVYSGSIPLAGAGAFIVGNLYSTSASNTGVLSFNSGGQDYLAGGFLPWSSGFSAGLPSGADAYYNGSGNNNRSYTMNSTMLYGYVTTEGIYGNGSLLYSANNGTTPLTLTYGAIGARSNGASASLGSNVDISEIILTASPLSTPDRQKLEGYLAWKWGLVANLPADHPYKSLPPTV